MSGARQPPPEDSPCATRTALWLIWSKVFACPHRFDLPPHQHGNGFCRPACGENRTDIRIVFTDVDMPGSMDGVKLAAAVRGRWPPIEILVVSGLRDVDVAELPERSRFIRKPYESRDVIDALIEMAA